MKRIWLTWEIQRRNRSLSTKLHADLYEITSNGSRFIRYPIQILKTLKILFYTKPSIVFSQNPSLLLTALTVIYGKFAKSIIVVDAHNAGIFPLEGKSKLLNSIAKIINSHSDKVIVSNPALEQFIKKNKSDVFAIPDPVPCISKHKEFPFKQNKFNLVFICSWAEDEPYEEVLKISENLSDTVNIYITGRSRNKEKSILSTLPRNVTLTGFLPDHIYEDLIFTCDAIMVLTKRENCLVCGAYEGVAVEKPMVLSKTHALVDYFNKGCIYTDNSSIDIEICIRKLILNYNSLKSQIIILKHEQEQKMNIVLREFNHMIETENQIV